MLSILHVEDSEIDHELTRYHLLKQTDKIEITWTDSANKALEILKTGVFDCILSDFQMPGMDGLEFLKTIRGKGVLIPFIFLTSQGNERIAAEALRNGADDYYNKAETIAHYQRIINSIKNLKRARDSQQQHRKALEDLRRRDAELSSIFRAAPTGIGVVVDRVLTQVNQKFLDMTGYTYDELAGKNSRILYPSDEEFQFVGEEKYRQIREKGTGTVTTRFQRKDGNIIYVLLSSTPQDISDLSKGVTFTALDITDQIRADTALRESEAKFRKLFEKSGDAIFIVEKSTGRYLDANEAAKSLTGYSIKELKKLTTHDITPARSNERLEAISGFDESLDFGEVTYIQPDGSKKYALLSSLSLDEKRAYGIARDITNRKKAEQQLRESEQKYKSLTENIRVGVFRSGHAADGRLIEANKAMVDLFGFESRSEFMSVAVSDLYADPGERTKLKEELVTKGHVRNREILSKRKDGSEFVGSVTVTAVRDEKGNIVYHDGILENITERKAVEEQVRLTQFAIDNSSDPAFWMGSDARFTYVNDAATRSLGYSREELLAMTVHDIDPDFPPEAWPSHWEEIKDRRSFTIESRHKTKEGQIIPVDITVNYVEFEGKEFNCAFARDITDRKMAEKALLEIEEKYRDMIEKLKADSAD